jgi:hypothetical protein
MLAELRLNRSQDKTSSVIPWDDADNYKVKGHGIVEIQLHVMKQMAYKHALKREVLYISKLQLQFIIY